MRILVTNDDGIYAAGIRKLAEAASKYGDVYVVAPMEQCSAMSHRITIGKDISVGEIDNYEVKVEKAYAIGGTPADCVKIAVEVLEVKPDIVLSGINKGYNAGMDISYSGTVAAAMEAVLKGIPSIALSMSFEENYEIIDALLPGVLEELLKKPLGVGQMWNVNFPECTSSQCKGILWDRTVEKKELFSDRYLVTKEDSGIKNVVLSGTRIEDFNEGTDLKALEDHYVSISTLTNIVMGERIC